MKIKTLLFLFILAFVGVQLGAVELKINASEFIEVSNFQDDYIYLGERLQFKGETEDLFFAGEEFDFTGISKSGIFAVGRNLDFAGNIGNGLVAAGRIINISSSINSTNMLAAEKIIINPNSQIHGDSFMAGRIVKIDGEMEGDAYISAAEISINNTIKGDLKVYAGQLKISENGKIIGNLSYESDQELTAAEAARVTGTISFEQSGDPHFFENVNDDYFSKSLLFSFLFKISFVVCGLLFLLFPITKYLDQSFTHKKLVSNALWGLIPMFIYPTAIVLSIILVITLPLSMVMILGFIPLIFITKAVGVTMIGSFLSNSFNLNTNNRFVYFLIGAFVYSALSFVPYFGFLLLLFVSSIGAGVLMASLIRKQLV
jgi:hypothetical protein